jgi:hypothetical protein
MNLLHAEETDLVAEIIGVHGPHCGRGRDLQGEIRPRLHVGQPRV